MTDHLRRKVLEALGLGGLTSAIASSPLAVLAAAEADSAAVDSSDAALRRIPSSNVRIPAIGMGTWITFNVPADGPQADSRIDVMRAFLDAGGGMVDSSPMYGHAEELIGHCLERVGAYTDSLFAASKIWTPLGALATMQMRNTESLWGIRPMDLMYVHNLLNTDAHLPRLRDWQAEGRVKHIGVTTSHGRRHEELAGVLRKEPMDVVQLTYNMRDREAEELLLPLAADKGVAVVINRPLQRGALPDDYAGTPLPGIATELGCQSWAQFFLLWVISHPHVNCAIPATTRVDHVRENLAVAALEMPEDATRRAMLAAL